jgi:Tfp pilus assembly protein PilF
MQRLNWCVVLVLCLSMVACDQKKQKQEVYDKWNSARAAVQGNLAAEQYKNANLPEARKSIDEAMKMDPKNVAYRLLSAQIYIETAALEPAQRELDTVRVLDPKNAHADYLSGIVYQRWQRPNLALEYYSKAAEKSPADPSYLMAKAEMMIQVGQAAEAISLLEGRLAYFEHSGPIRDMLGGLYLQHSRVKEAVAIFQQATILSPDDLDIREHYVRALFRAQQYRDCIGELTRLMKDDVFGKRADLHLLLGECYLQTGNTRDAKAEFETAADLSPDMVAAWLGIAKAAITLNDLDRCDAALKKAVSLDPQNAQVHLAIGFLRMKQDRSNEAIAALEKASQLDPKDPVSLCLLGDIQERAGKKDLAMEYYAKALLVRPDDELARSRMKRAK